MAATLMTNEIEVVLGTPITIGDKQVSVLKLRKPKAGDLRSIGNLDKPFSVIMDLAANLGNLSKAEIDSLEIPDLTALIDALSPFLPKLQ